MIQALQDFLNGPVNFDHVLLIFILYLLVIWFLVPMWVYMDARKKYPSNKYLPWVLFFVILPFNIPGVIFYIIIRPDEFQLADMNNDGVPDAFFNVPMVNFVSDKKDLVMSLELKINSELIDPRIKRDLNLKVDMQANEEAIRIIEGKVEKIKDSEDSDESKASFRDKLSVIATGVKEYLFKKDETSEMTEEGAIVSQAEDKKSEDKEIKQN